MNDLFLDGDMTPGHFMSDEAGCPSMKQKANFLPFSAGMKPVSEETEKL